MLTQLPHLPAASANALTGTRTLGAAPLVGKPAHRRAANEPHAHSDPRSPAGTDLRRERGLILMIFARFLAQSQFFQIKRESYQQSGASVQ
jgi:hypothetical protein